jgi:hypothetical protein
MNFDKPIHVPVRHLLGAVGSGVLGFRYSESDRHESGLRRANPRHPALIDQFIVDLLVRARTEGPGSFFVRREALAAHLEVPEHFVSQSLERLNKRGLLGSEHNALPHDVARGPHASGSGWSGSVRDANLEHIDAMVAERRRAEPAPARRMRLW